jgi:hypothetical protein
VPSRRYRIPDTRLPFINAEIAEVNFRGAPHLVSSIYGGGSGGRLYFWNPDTGSRAMRPLPDGLPGAYMLKAGPDGTLYLGCAGGDLRRYDGERDRFETLVTGELDGLCWGGIVAPPFVLWNASRGGRSGAVGVYDLRAGRCVHVFAPLDGLTPTALYGHRAVMAPDGRVLWCMNTPQARLVLIDLKAMRAESRTPDCLAGNSWTNATFLDERRLAVFSGRGEVGEDLYVLSWPGLDLIRRMAVPTADNCVHEVAFPVGGHVYRINNGTGDLWRMDRATLAWERAAADWTAGDCATVGLWRGRQPCAVTLCGEALRYDPADGRTDRLDLEATGLLGAHALCAVPQEALILGAPFINQRFWRIDLPAGEGRDLGRAAPRAGQVNQIVWDPQTRRAFLSSYTTCTVTAYDPARPAAWPRNPAPVACAQERGQMRPMALVHDGRHLWMGTSPHYGTLGGALCRIDPRTGVMDTWPHVVQDQKVNAVAVAPSRRLVYFSTDVEADCGSCPPTQTTARVAAFDMDALRVAAELPAPEGCGWSRVEGALPDGRVLLRYGRTIYAWDPAGGAPEAFAEMPDEVLSVLVGPGGALIAAARESLGVFAERDGRRVYEPRLPLGGAAHLQIAQDALYCAVGYEIVETPLAELGIAPRSG